MMMHTVHVHRIYWWYDDAHLVIWWCTPYMCTVYIGDMMMHTWWYDDAHLVMMTYTVWPEPYMHTVYGRMYGNFSFRNNIHRMYVCMYVFGQPCLHRFGSVPAKSNLHTLYVRMYVCFWPTLFTSYLTVYLVVSLPKVTYTHCMYVCMYVFGQPCLHRIWPYIW